jgi:hypothetical protein
MNMACSDVCKAKIEARIQAVLDNPGNDAVFSKAEKELRGIIDCRGETDWQEQQTGKIVKGCVNCPLRENECLLSTHVEMPNLLEMKREIVVKMVGLEALNEDEKDTLGRVNARIDEIQRTCTCLIDRVYNAWYAGVEE